MIFFAIDDYLSSKAESYSQFRFHTESKIFGSKVFVKILDMINQAVQQAQYYITVNFSDIVSLNTSNWLDDETCYEISLTILNELETAGFDIVESDDELTAIIGWLPDPIVT